MYANPLPGFIHPKGWVRPAGNTEFAVTRTCADHRATNQGCALDIWNGRADGKVMAIAPGRVVTAYPPEGIVRIDHGNGDTSAYAHMYPIAVAFGQTVTTGQQLGEVGDAHSASIPNFSGPHLHFAIERGGVEIDPWPFLNQNPAAAGDDMTLIELVKFEAPRRWAAKTSKVYTGYKPDGSTTQAQLNAGSWALADGIAEITQNPQKAPNGSGFVHVINGAFEGWYLLGADVDVDPAPPVAAPSGFTQAQLDTAVAKASMDAKVAAAKAGAEGAAKAATDFAASLPK